MGRDKDALKDRLQRLSVREMEVLKLVAEGWNNRYIARVMFIEASTLGKHLTGITQKLEVEGDPDRHPRVTAVLAYYNRPQALLESIEA